MAESEPESALFESPPDSLSDPLQAVANSASVAKNANMSLKVALRISSPLRSRRYTTRSNHAPQLARSDALLDCCFLRPLVAGKLTTCATGSWAER